MLPIEPPAEEFRNLTFVQVSAAMRFSTDMTPVVAEVFRLVNAYVAAMEEMVAVYGEVPEDFRIIPRYPIEEVAHAWMLREMQKGREERERPANENTGER
jgi:hypothetical protein